MELKYLLIVFVIALALAPLSHFVPSKRQRHIARLREYAAVHGLFVEFRSLPGTARERADGHTIYYGKRLPASRAREAGHRAWLRDGSAWRALERRGEVPAVLHQFPRRYWPRVPMNTAVASTGRSLERWRSWNRSGRFWKPGRHNCGTRFREFA